MCCTHIMEYMYKITENAKTRQNGYFEMAPKTRTLLHTYFKIISLHSVCQETFFSVANNGEGGGGIRLCRLLWPQGNLTGSNWHTEHLDYVSYKIRLQLTLWDTYEEKQIFWTKSPCGAPGGPDWTKIDMHN